MTDDAPDRPADAFDASLSIWRDRIDAIDRQIVTLLNERAACAAEIGHVKHAAGLPVYAPRREEAVQANAAGSNGGPLSPDALRRLFERIIDETRSLEREMAGDTDASDASPPSA